jgi:hypothetical protein
LYIKSFKEQRNDLGTKPPITIDNAASGRESFSVGCSSMSDSSRSSAFKRVDKKSSRSNSRMEKEVKVNLSHSKNANERNRNAIVITWSSSQAVHCYNETGPLRMTKNYVERTCIDCSSGEGGRLNGVKWGLTNFYDTMWTVRPTPHHLHCTISLLSTSQKITLHHHRGERQNTA